MSGCRQKWGLFIFFFFSYRGFYLELYPIPVNFYRNTEYFRMTFFLQKSDDLNSNLKIDNSRDLNYQYNYLSLLNMASRLGVPQARYRYTAGGEKLGVTNYSG